MQRRDYRKIAGDVKLMQEVFRQITDGPEHNAYYDVLGFFHDALAMMTMEQRLKLLHRYEIQFEIFNVKLKDLK